MSELNDEVLRRVGRNLLLFQQIEGLFKFLLANAQVRGYASELDQVREARSERVQSQTMGQLVGQYLEEVLTDGEPVSQSPGDLKGAWLSFSFQLEADGSFYEQQKSDLKAIVDQRNELVHHFLQRWKPSLADSTHAALDSLDRQRQAALPIRDHLMTVVKDFQASLKAHAEFLASEEGQLQLERAWLMQSPLVVLLRDIATTEDDRDGWIPLGTAGRLLRQRAPDEVATLLERYGYRTLKELLVGAGCFEMRDEPTAKGGVRAVYRLRPESTLASNAEAPLNG